MKGLLMVVMIASAGALSAQEVLNGGPVNVIDGVYIQEHLPTRRPIECFVSKEEFVWNRAMWRTIESGSNPRLFMDADSSGAALWNVLRKHVLEGDLALFSAQNPYNDTLTDGGSFKYPVFAEAPADFRQQVFPYFGTLSSGNASDTVWILPEDIVEYHLREDWFFDKDRSVLDVKIVGIAPVSCQKGEIEPQELFWLYFPDCREILRSYAVPGDQDMSFDVLFRKRLFSSSIARQSLTKGNDEPYLIFQDALQESEKTAASMKRFEQDVWNF